MVEGGHDHGGQVVQIDAELAEGAGDGLEVEVAQ